MMPAESMSYDGLSLKRWGNTLPGRVRLWRKYMPPLVPVHCGGTCLMKVHVQNGRITRIETDDGEEPQLRCCLRCRAYRQRVYAPDRIQYPLRRVGPRGKGEFERISWGEAFRR